VRSVAGELGFEPRLTESESAVLPLNYSPTGDAEPSAGAALGWGPARPHAASYLTAADRLGKLHAQTCGCSFPFLATTAPACLYPPP
jgi:hypothetical protein